MIRPCSETKGMVDSIFSSVLLMPRSRTDVVMALVGGIGALAMLDCLTRVSRFLLGVRQLRRASLGHITMCQWPPSRR